MQLPPKFTLELVQENVSMDDKNEGMPDWYVAGAENTSQIENTSHPGSLITPPTTKRRSRYDVDNHGQRLDREAALFSHVENTPQCLTALKCKQVIEGPSNETMENWPKIIDRSNMLKDAPTKYRLEDSAGCPGESAPAAILPIPKSWICKVDKNIRLTPNSHWQDVRKLSIRVYGQLNPNPDIPTQIRPGDIAIVYPKNFPQDVQAIIDLMNWGEVADKPFRHVPGSADIPHLTPKNCYPRTNSTLRHLLIHNYDITCIPRRTFFELAASHTEDSTHQERLREFADPGHSDEFQDYTSRPRRSILEVLQDFPSIRIPHQLVPAFFPVIRGREYSIASGGEICNTPDGVYLDLVIALVKYKTVLRKTRQGLCSRYIASLKPDTPINISIRENSVPAIVMNARKPLLAIAAGTGIAPIRALLHHREAFDDPQETLLFYGGRNHDADFLFEEEWKDLAINVITAFSRDQPSKIYVQHRLLENFDKVCQLLRKGATICLCGSSGKMPEAVRLALYDCMIKGKLVANRDQAKEILHKRFTFWEEVW